MTKNIDEKIKKAFDSASGNSDLVHLNAKQADKFIDYVVDESVILKNSRVVRMDTPIVNIAKVGIGDKIFYPAESGTALDSSKRVKANTGKIELSSKEIIGEVLVLDDELEDNIEGEAFANHLLQMIAKKGSNQLEETALYGQKITSGTPPDLKNQFDGFITEAENNGVVIDANVGFSDRYIERAKLTKLYKSIDTKYRKSLDGLFVPSDLIIDWEDLYTTNVTTAEGARQRGRYAGRDFIDTPLISTERGIVDGAGGDTTTDDVASKAQKIVPVADTTNFTAGDGVKIIHADPAKTEYHTIASVQAGVSITLVDDLVFDHVSGEVVKEVDFDAGDILWTPKQNLLWGIQRDIRIERDRQASLRGTVFVITSRIDFKIENSQALGLIKNLKVK